MPESMICPTLPEILKALRPDAAPAQVIDLARHLATCPSCASTLARLNIASTAIDRLRSVQASGVSGEEMERLIASFASAVGADRSTAPPEQTVVTNPGLIEDGVSLLAPPVEPNELGRIGGYRVLRVLGSGGMGAVFEAEDPDLHRKVAVKVPHRSVMKHPGARERFLREARAAATLKDPHVVTIYQVGQANDLPFLAMELLTGEPLDARLEREGKLPVSEVLRIGREAAQGLAEAHEQGLIHRDVKPANIFLSAGRATESLLPGMPTTKSGPRPRPDAGRVKVLDFGLARLSSPNTRLTGTGQIMGTPHYMAPEQARGDEVDPRADLFSLGCVLYEMATGDLAFAGSSAMAVLTALATTTPPPLRSVRPDLPPELDDLVARLLSKDPAGRPATAWEVIEALQAIEQGLTRSASASLPPPASAPPPGSAPALPPTPVKTRGLALAAITVVIVGAVAVAWSFRSRPQTTDAGAPPPVPTGVPIRVGVLHSRTGTMAQSEKPVIDATLLAIEEINKQGGLLGSPLEPIVEDGESEGAVFARKSEQLIVRDKVAAVFGCWTSASRKAVRPIYEKHDHLLLYPVQYEGLEQSPNIVYLGAAPNQQIIPAVTWCCAFLKKKRLFLVGSDYVFPRAANAIIRDQAASLGAEIVGEEYLRLGSTDVQPIVRKIAASNAEVILNTINGDTNVAFFRGLRAEGVTPAKMPTISFSVSEEELTSFGPKDVAGDYAAWNYFQNIDSPRNEAFVKRFRARYGESRVVSDPMEAAYVGVYLWAQAVRQANRFDPKAVRQALGGQTFDAPEGRVRIDAETQHTEKFVRIGQITAEGRIAIVYCSEQAIVPIPFPRTRPRADWDAFLNDLHLRWGGQWANPGK